jgi:hypothetical protein
MSDRRIDVFFYGLFVDVGVLRETGVAPANPRRAYVDDFALRIGRRATLLPAGGARAYGLVAGLTHAEIDRLYRAPDLEHYRPEAVTVQPLDGAAMPALCFSLPEAPPPDERNAEYAARLQRALLELAFPPEYVASVARA